MTRSAGLALGVMAVLGTASASAGDYEFGRYLSAECTTCHQLSGKTVGGIPAITGWPEDQFIAVMAAYRDKQRDNPVMQAIAARLGADDVAALATFFGKQPAQ